MLGVRSEGWLKGHIGEVHHLSYWQYTWNEMSTALCLHAERQEQLEREIEKRRHDLSMREAALADAERASERKWRDLSRELHDKVGQPELWLKV